MGPEQIAELSRLLSSLLVVDSTIAMAKASAPRKNNTREETLELVREFLQLNPEAQRGAIRYIKEMRKGYQKVKG